MSLVLMLASCIVNDLPMPVRVAEVTSMDVDGAVSVTLDPARMTASIVLEETSDISKVNVRTVSFRHSFTTCEPEMVDIHDLSAPKVFNLHTYQDYRWTVSAVRPVERWFTVRGQIGASVIDDANHRAVAYVSTDADLAEITVTSLKLGPRDISSYQPAMSEIHDFTVSVPVQVSYHGTVEEWTLFVEQTEVSVSMDSVDPWTRCAWLAADGVAGSDNGFRVRMKGGEEWTEITDVTSDGGHFTACADALEPETAYECLAFSGGDVTDIYEFVTEAEVQLPNAGFNFFSNAESGVYSSWFDPASGVSTLLEKWWDSGNIGSTTVGSAYCIAMPDTEDKVEGEASAALISRNVIIKFAAGNTFSGEFASLVGTQGGIINFGRPWTLRPRAVRFWAKYNCGKIDIVDGYPADSPVKTGDPDNCQIWVALGDWDYRKFGGTQQCPVQVNTTDRSSFFNPASDAVIAYGSFVADCSSTEWSGRAEVLQLREDGWAEIELPLDYTSVSRVPTHIIVSFASSRLGDYFTGSSSSVLHIDDVRMVY